MLAGVSRASTTRAVASNARGSAERVLGKAGGVESRWRVTYLRPLRRQSLPIFIVQVNLTDYSTVRTVLQLATVDSAGRPAL